VVTSELFTLIAAVAVFVVAFGLPALISRRIKHGEARFDKDGKLIEDE